MSHTLQDPISILFQFYDSPIKRKKPHRNAYKRDGFNSMIVRLKVRVFEGQKAHRGGFNSMIVRLKAGNRFATQKGGSCFNSMIVRLKAGRVTFIVLTASVSIL